MLIDQLGNGSFFISFEGIEGSGKTTQINLLKEYFSNLGKDVLCLREPGGTDFGEALRNAILNSNQELHPLAEAHLFAASRAQLLKEKILPHLAKDNAVVLVDRFIDSSFAYQGVARGLGIDTILEIHQHRPLCYFPQHTFYLKISVEKSLERQEMRGNTKDYFEKEKSEFYKKLVEGFNQCLNRFPERVITINGDQSIQSIHSEICSRIKL